ncbi:phenylalanine--tRNA ligase subunit beta [Kocuria sp. HSID16901]|uniref:phenylalanine--tRNA ligase subunit beta n=1 Tax=Kocuria sp. HSID16901 TaxID=2419505 RepID=UPI0006607FDF|nr:phenylalanine--tRNA ligase subunit beta [Kocuria sp. HSID16901]RUQ21095.1 phenylalanine--tRNA ligase subunit beta [Kocuria sp. HSID16901]
MRIPLSWLREYAPLPEGASAEYVMETLVRVGLEEEAVHRPSDEISGPVVVGQVLTMEPEEHSNGKTVNWCTVRVVPEGQQQTLTGPGIEPSGVQGIICGAHNFAPGDKVVVTLPGAVLPGNFAISARKTYGHVSAGMIASVRELGIGEDHDGILVLSRLGLDPEIGSDALQLLGLDDEAAEVEVTPDRGYAFSIRGIAREYCHAINEPFTDPVEAVNQRVPQDNGAGHHVVLDDDAPIHGRLGATRFVARTVANIDPTAPTPTWMSSRLRLAGIRSISLPVDISNYVMLEFGQPLHFYDADRIQGDIVVRRAQQGETLTTLDGKERKLNPEDLLITDATGPIGLAGVMGGGSTEVTASTRRILVEAARFEEVSIARTRRRHKLPSEASKRFERGVDPLASAAAAQRAVELLEELAGGQAEDGVTDVFEHYFPHEIHMALDYPSRLIGVDVSESDVEKILQEIGAKVVRTGEVLQVTVPSWRPDLSEAEDLVEEIARLTGYEKIPSRLPVPPSGRGLTVHQAARRRASDALAAAGLTEAVSYPFVSPADNELFGAAEAGTTVRAVKLANPISESQGYLQTSLLPGLAQVLKRNHARGFRDLALFESALVFHPGEHSGTQNIPAVGVKPDAGVLADLNAGLPHQPRHLAAMFCGHDAQPSPGVTPRAYDWQDALDAARMAAASIGVDITIRQGRHQAFHPGRTAELLDARGRHLGFAGELHPQVTKDRDLPERTVAMELNFDTLAENAGHPVEAQEISGYPAVSQDVALVVDSELPAAELMATLREGAGELLESVRVFDEYSGEGIEPGHKSLAFALRFRAPDRTLTNDEASEARQAAIDLASHRHAAVMRG